MTVSVKGKDKNKKEIRDIKSEALKIANSQKIDGQTKEQTKLIARGIQRGMEQYLRQQSEKARELEKRTKKIKRIADAAPQLHANHDSRKTMVAPDSSTCRLPWLLLAVSLGLFLTYVVVYPPV